jgi:hypothetical protein
VVVPQHFGDVGHAHRGTRVTGIGFLDGIHGQGADGVGYSCRVIGLKTKAYIRYPGRLPVFDQFVAAKPAFRPLALRGGRMWK